MKDPNKPERIRKIFVRKTDVIHTNHSLWSSLITLNGIIIAINTVIWTNTNYNVTWAIYLCMTSILLLVTCFYCSRYRLETKITTLEAKNNKGKNHKKDKNEKWYYKTYVRIIIPTLWKELLALTCISFSLMMTMYAIISANK